MSFFGSSRKEEKSAFVDDGSDEMKEYGVPYGGFTSEKSKYPDMYQDPTAPRTTISGLAGSPHLSLTDRIYNAASYLRLPTPLAEFYDNASRWRSKLNLPFPGTTEKFGSEYRMTKVDNYLFEGGKAELTKAISLQPVFQVVHSFNLQNPGSPARQPAYNLTAVYANAQSFLQASVSDEGSLMARANFAWNARHTTKIQAQVSNAPGGTMTQFEHDYQGNDYAANVKALPNSLADGTGIYLMSYLQSITKNIALGVEGVYQYTEPDLPEMGLSYLAKMTGNDHQGRNWVATATLQGANLSTSYWHRLSDRVDVGTDLTLALLGSPGSAAASRAGIATVGAKYDFRMAQFRGMLDSMGRISAVIEQRLTPIFSVTISGEIDHVKNNSRFGVGVSFEAMDPALQAEAEAQAASGQAPAAPPV